MTTTLHHPQSNTANIATRLVIAALVVVVAIVGLRATINNRETAPPQTQVAVKHPGPDPTGLGAAFAVTHTAISGDPMVADPSGLGAVLAVPRAAISGEPMVADPSGLGAALSFTPGAGAIDD